MRRCVIFDKQKFKLLIGFILLCSIACKHRVVRSNGIEQTEDSICRYGKRYAYPPRIKVNFPAIKVSDAFKLQQLHIAIPDSFNNDTCKQKRLYDYYFVDSISDFSLETKSRFKPRCNPGTYKLKDTYFFDINGDGKLDFIHYPEFYRAIMWDLDLYEMFILQSDGDYKMVRFNGYIYDISFNNDGSLVSLKTFQGFCCDDNHNFFYAYKYDRSKDELVMTSKEDVLTCQLIEDK